MKTNFEKAYDMIEQFNEFTEAVEWNIKDESRMLEYLTEQSMEAVNEIEHSNCSDAVAEIVYSNHNMLMFKHSVIEERKSVLERIRELAEQMKTTIEEYEYLEGLE